MKSDADPLGQAATQAPQPMHWAASMAVSTVSFGMSMVLASCAPPVGEVM